MIKSTKFLTVSACALGFLVGCAQTPESPEYPVTDRAIKYSIRHLEMDITQSTYKVGHNLKSAEETETFLRDYLLKSMEAKGLLADASDVNVVDLDIFVDFQRRFVGDKTPFPIDKLVSPHSWFREKHYLGDELLQVTQTQILNDIKGIPLAGLVTNDDSLQYRQVGAVANTIIERMENYRQLDANAFAFKTQGLNDAAIIAKRMKIPAENATELEPKGLGSADYIPADVVEPYLADATSNEIDERIEVYKSLVETWINDTNLYDNIDARVKNHYLSTNEDVVEELDWAIKALAYSGLTRYKETVALVAKQAKNEDFRKHAEGYLFDMDERVRLANMIHDTRFMEPGISWRVNQLSNMLRSGEAALRSQAVKEIYREHGENTYLLEQLSQILDKESRDLRFRYSAQADFYAWICRVLGDSGHAKFKPLLEEIAEKSAYEKVREFAEEYADELG